MPAGTPVNEEFWIYSPELLLQNYEPGQTYSVVVIGVDSEANKIGFEATAEDDAGNKVGTFVAGFGGFTQILNGGTSITHTALGSTPIADTGTVFFFSWIAPATNVGDVTFYTAVNTANGNGNNTGDQIHFSQFKPGTLGVGIAQNEETQFNMYPNPSDGMISISNTFKSSTTAQVMNIKGQVVKEVILSDQVNSVDLSELKQGIYFVRIGNNTQKLVIN
ncbi:MAG TPA: T9SS type A sorting domain-containing protein [Bacteroidales bacterium]|nr:T9SS type A sorting domain-containing protein [Bacteroidales bacterium]HPE56777.1 T9SS type A sorting domain-containing protein [Bacteroidales bacterium]HRX96863.1 T9SS type A sorting domain-containing protein [Bacteroidales bacterium]